jgi:3-oxoadipyl-CoA thiolase
LSSVRVDDLAALTLRTLLERNPVLDPGRIDDVVLGCANQAGEDNRNLARMALLLAGLPETVPGMTINRLCGSGIDAIGTAARAIESGQMDLILTGGAESMSRAPFVLPKADSAFARNPEIYDTTLGWRFINLKLQALYGTDSMAETAENVAEEFSITRPDQDAFAYRSQQRALRAAESGYFAAEIVPVTVRGKKSTVTVDRDEHPRPETSLVDLAKLATPFRKQGAVTAGNASGINDGAAAMIVASEYAIKANKLTPRARILGMSAAGVAPRIMGIGPVPATQKLMTRLGLSIDNFDWIELNEAFASQSLACLRQLGIADDSERVNPNGGAIALGHPLGMSGARLVMTAAHQLHAHGGKRALATMCIGVGQGISLALESV